MRLKLLLAVAVALTVASAEAADAPPLYKSWKDWSGYCLSSGVCTIMTGAGDGEFAIFRAPAADEPAYACYQAFSADESPRWILTVEGATILAGASLGTSLIPWDGLLESEPTSSLAAYARHLKGNGMPPCPGPLQLHGLEVKMLEQGRRAGLEIGPEAKKVPVSLDGFTALATWLDDRQNRVGTTTALSRPGARPPVAGPSAPAIASIDAIPADVRTVWSAPDLACDQIEPQFFAASDAVAVPLETGKTLYLLPCGQPGNNAPFVAITQSGSQAPELVTLASDEDGKVTTSTTAGRLTWDGRNRALVSTWSLGYKCNAMTVWPYADGAFAQGTTTQSAGCN